MNIKIYFLKQYIVRTLSGYLFVQAGEFFFPVSRRVQTFLLIYNNVRILCLYCHDMYAIFLNKLKIKNGKNIGHFS